MALLWTCYSLLMFYYGTYINQLMLIPCLVDAQKFLRYGMVGWVLYVQDVVSWTLRGASAHGGFSLARPLDEGLLY